MAIPTGPMTPTMPYGAVAVPESSQGLPGAVPEVVAVRVLQLVLPLRGRDTHRRFTSVTAAG